MGGELDHPAFQEAALVGATYGLTHRALGAVGLLGPVRMDYDKAIRSVRSAARELSRFVEEVYEDNEPSANLSEGNGDGRTRLLRAARRLADCGATARSSAPFGDSPASSIPTSRASPMPTARFREVVDAYEVLSNSERRELYDRFGHAGLRSGGFQPGSFDLGSLSDLFSAFFGDDLFGGRAARARGRGHRRARRDRPGRGRDRHEARRSLRGRRAVLALRR